MARWLATILLLSAGCWDFGTFSKEYRKGDGGGGTGGPSSATQPPAAGMDPAPDASAAGGASGTSGTSGTSGSGGTSGAPAMCTIPAGDTAPCDHCGFMNCCAQRKACDAEPDCIRWEGCFDSCPGPGPECAVACDNQHPTGGRLEQAIETCLMMYCAQQCSP